MIVLELDRSREARLTNRDIFHLEARGFPLPRLWAHEAPVELVFWLALRHEDAELTLEAAGELLDLAPGDSVSDQYLWVKEKLVELLVDTVPKKKRAAALAASHAIFETARGELETTMGATFANERTNEEGSSD